ncbi:MAG: hypothetical protein RSC44_05795 [Clostridia bacterium]
MAKKSKKTASNQASTQSNARPTKHGGMFLNKLSFFTICTVAVLYLVSSILGALQIDLVIVGALQGVATALLILIASAHAWKFVAHKSAIWVVVFIVCLLVVVIGIILPLVLA